MNLRVFSLFDNKSSVSHPRRILHKMTTHGKHGMCPYLKSSSAILSSLWRSASALILGQGEILSVNSRLEQPLKTPMLKA